MGPRISFINQKKKKILLNVQINKDQKQFMKSRSNKPGKQMVETKTAKKMYYSSVEKIFNLPLQRVSYKLTHKWF